MNNSQRPVACYDHRPSIQLKAKIHEDWARFATEKTHVRFISPYLTGSTVCQLIKQSTSFVLLTDLSESLYVSTGQSASSINTLEALIKLKKSLKKLKIFHLRGLHAKAALFYTPDEDAPGYVTIGSQNATEMGKNGQRYELSTVFQRYPDAVEEFNSIWKQFKARAEYQSLSELECKLANYQILRDELHRQETLLPKHLKGGVKSKLIISRYGKDKPRIQFSSPLTTLKLEEQLAMKLCISYDGERSKVLWLRAASTRMSTAYDRVTFVYSSPDSFEYSRYKGHDFILTCESMGGVVESRDNEVRLTLEFTDDDTSSELVLLAVVKDEKLDDAQIVSNTNAPREFIEAIERPRSMLLSRLYDLMTSSQANVEGEILSDLLLDKELYLGTEQSNSQHFENHTNIHVPLEVFLRGKKHSYFYIRPLRQSSQN